MAERGRVMRDPFVGLRPFGSDETDIFFGRSDDIAILKNLVTSQPVVIVYATSGTGKSSLLTAGLIPQLERDNSTSIVYVRDPAEDVVAAVRRELGLDEAPEQAEFALHQALEEHSERKGSRAVVVIDQFEERLKRSETSADLWGSLAYIANSRLDLGCVIISIREDYLAELSDLFEVVPGLLDGSFRVPNLSDEAFIDAVRGPIGAVGGGVTVPQALMREVLEDLRRQARRVDFESDRIEAGYFQIVWSYLWELPRTRERREIAVEDYRVAGGARGIVARFVDSTLDSLLPLEKEALYAVIRYMVLPTGAKVPLTIDDLAGLVSATDYTAVGARTIQTPFERTLSMLNPLFHKLTSSQAPLFRRVTRGSRVEYELVHDLLGRILRDWRDEFAKSSAELMDALTGSFSERLAKTIQAVSESKPASVTSADEYVEWFERLAAVADSDLNELSRGARHGSATALPILDLKGAGYEHVLVRIVATVAYLGKPIDYLGSGNFRVTYELHEAVQDDAAKLREGLRKRVDSILDELEERLFSGVSAGASSVRSYHDRLIRLGGLRNVIGAHVPGGTPFVRTLPTPLGVRVRRGFIAAAVGSALGFGGFALSWTIISRVLDAPPIAYFALTALVAGATFSVAYGLAFNITGWSSGQWLFNRPDLSGFAAIRHAAFPHPGGSGSTPGRAWALRTLAAWPTPILIHILVATGGAKLFEHFGWAPTAGFDFVGLIFLIPALVGIVVAAED
jgi:hypothetical protein